MLHLQRIRKERVFFLVQISCACFVFSLLAALGALLVLAAKKNPGPRWKLLGCTGFWCGVAMGVLGMALAVISLLAMRHRHFPRQDRHLCRIAFALDLFAVLALLLHPWWLAWLGL